MKTARRFTACAMQQSCQKLDLAKSYQTLIALLVILDIAQVGCVLIGASALS